MTQIVPRGSLSISESDYCNLFYILVKNCTKKRVFIFFNLTCFVCLFALRGFDDPFKDLPHPRLNPSLMELLSHLELLNRSSVSLESFVVPRSPTCCSWALSNSECLVMWIKEIHTYDNILSQIYLLLSNTINKDVTLHTYIMCSACLISTN